MGKTYCSVKGCGLFPLENGLCWKHQKEKPIPEEEKPKKKQKTLKK